MDDTKEHSRNNIERDSTIINKANERLLQLSNQVIGLTTALEILQGQFEEQSRELRNTRKEREAARVQASIFQKQVETRDTTIIALKDERSELKKQVQNASDALKTSEVPGLSEMERMRASLVAAEKEKDRANARLKSGETTSEYMRTEYQKASGRAMELTSENDALKAQVSGLENKASGEAVKLKQLLLLDREKAWQDEVEQLRGRIESLEVLVTRLQEQKRDLQNAGRVQTRQGSLPPSARSPRIGPLSRAASPAPTSLNITGSRLREGVKLRGAD